MDQRGCADYRQRQAFLPRLRLKLEAYALQYGCHRYSGQTGFDDAGIEARYIQQRVEEVFHGIH